MERFAIDIAEAVLEDLHRRLDTTRWTEDFANDDWRYGANANYMRELAGYWRHQYDWRARERLMNGFAHFRTELQGMPIHFIHERGQGPAPVPIILNHGWPWSFWDFHKIIGPLRDPAAHGGDPRDAFDVIVPSLPGYGFSTPLRVSGINWWKTADTWTGLMDRLGYGRFASAGGDWGSFISAQLGHKYAARVIGIHIHTPAPLDFMSGGMFDAGDYAAEEMHLVQKMQGFRGSETGYFALQCTKPQTPLWRLMIHPPGCSPGWWRSGGAGAIATGMWKPASARMSCSIR